MRYSKRGRRGASSSLISFIALALWWLSGLGLFAIIARRVASWYIRFIVIAPVLMWVALRLLWSLSREERQRLRQQWRELTTRKPKQDS